MREQTPDALHFPQFPPWQIPPAQKPSVSRSNELVHLLPFTEQIVTKRIVTKREHIVTEPLL